MKENETFYEFSHNSSHTRGFTWAISIEPRSEMIDQVCPEYGAAEHYPSGAFDVIVEGGTRYPDVLGCGAYPFLIVSEAVITAWREAGINSFDTYPIGTAEVRSRKLRDAVPPPYFRVEIDGQCKINLAASGVEVVRFCPEHHYLVTRPSLVPGFRMVPGSWDGSPLFRDPVLYPRVNFCTQMVLDLAREHRFTNFRSEPMEGPFNSASKGIDYLGTQPKPR